MQATGDIFYVREYKAFRQSVLLSNIYSPVDQLFTFNVFPAESTHIGMIFSFILCCLLCGKVASFNVHLASIHEND